MAVKTFQIQGAVQLFFRFGPPRNTSGVKTGRDRDLESLSRILLEETGSPRLAALVEVWWNPRLRSTAGRAVHRRSKWDTGEWRVELNPRLQEFPTAETETTLRHELAHLVAQFRAGRRRIEPHGAEWRQACTLLGIPEEGVTHTLPLPRNTVRRRFLYQCPGCHASLERVRPVSRHAACGACCKKHNRGRYDARFRLQRVDPHGMAHAGASGTASGYEKREVRPEGASTGVPAGSSPG